jgi:Rrf2 family protein
LTDIVRLSEATALGLHAMVIVASHNDPISTADAAKRLQASSAHLAKVMQRLTKSGFLCAKRGPNGGYVLTRRADEITLLSIYEALEGPIRRDGCLFAEPVCAQVRCILEDLVVRVREEIERYLRETTLADVAKEKGR